MPDSSRRSLVAFFFWTYPTRTAAMVLLLVLAGLAEGVGLLTLLPLLELAMGTGEPSGFAVMVQQVLAAIGMAPSLGALLLLIAGTMAVKGVLVWFAMREVGYTMAEVSAGLRRRLVRALAYAEYGFFRNHPSGHVVTAVSSEAQRAAWAYKDACRAFADAFQGLMYVVVIVLVSWPVALAAPVFGVVLWAALRGLVYVSRRAGERRTEAMRQLVRRLSALLPNIKPVKAMSREGRLLGAIDTDIEAYKRAERKAIIATEAMAAFQEPIIVAMMVAGLFGALTYADMAFATVLALAILFYRLLQIVGRVQASYQAVAHGESAFWSLYDQVRSAEAAREPIASGADVVPAPALEEGLRFDRVTFAHVPGLPVLREATFDVPAGRLTTLVGPSGSGKTTLLDLTTGLVRPDEGAVLIDGVPLEAVDMRAWRGQIGYVPQELLLFHDTIAYNVTLGAPDVSPGDVEWALRAAGAWAFVEASLEGVGRVIGERGSKLSGGQGQRLMLARALVRRPRLLILDEATTGLDPETEQALCQTLLDLRGSLTIVAVSHQAALRDAADLVLTVVGSQVRPLDDLVSTS